MGKSSLAADWLEENDPASRSKPIVSVKHWMGYCRVPPMMHCELDIAAFDALRADEQSGKRGSKLRYPAPKTEAHGLRGIDFIEHHVGFNGLRCVLMPSCKFGTPFQVPHAGRNIPAARLMCIKAHGLPEVEGMIARHLCGRGHLSCINPSHLVWGTAEENAHDAVLHNGRPSVFPRLSDETVSLIQSDNRHYNILAVELNVHACVIQMVKQGLVPKDAREFF